MDWLPGPEDTMVRLVKGELAAECPAWLRCPQGHAGLVDQDQFHGRVSIRCVSKGCCFHETLDLAAWLAVA